MCSASGRGVKFKALRAYSTTEWAGDCFLGGFACLTYHGCDMLMRACGGKMCVLSV